MSGQANEYYMEKTLDIIKKKAIVGVKWVFVSLAFTELIKFISKIVLARILLPEDFGLATTAIFIVSLFNIFSELGISGALIQSKDNKRVTEAASFLFLIFGIIVFIACFLLSDIIASFFGEKILKTLIRILSFTILLQIFIYPPSSLLSKELEFKKRMFAEVTSSLGSTILMIALAIIGFGVFSLVYGYLSSVIIFYITILLITGHKPKFKYDLFMIKKLLRFAIPAFGVILLSMILLQGDNMVVMKLMGTTYAGYYMMAYLISNLPATHMTRVINNVSLPLFSKVQDDKKNLKKSYFKILKFSLWLAIPLSVGLSVLSKEIVIVLLTVKWEPIIVLIPPLAFFAIFRSITMTSSFFLHGVGKPNVDFKIMLFGTLLLVVDIIPLTLVYGSFGTAIAVIISMMTISFLETYVVIRYVKSDLKEVLNLSKPAIFSSVVMGLAVFFIKDCLLIDLNFLNLVLLISLGIFTYFINNLLFFRKNLDDIKNLIIFSLNVDAPK